MLQGNLSFSPATPMDAFGWEKFGLYLDVAPVEKAEDGVDSSKHAFQALQRRREGKPRHSRRLSSRKPALYTPAWTQSL